MALPAAAAAAAAANTEDAVDAVPSGPLANELLSVVAFVTLAFGSRVPALFVDVCDIAPGLKGPFVVPPPLDETDEDDDADELPDGLSEFSFVRDKGDGALCDANKADDD